MTKLVQKMEVEWVQKLEIDPIHMDREILNQPFTDPIKGHTESYNLHGFPNTTQQLSYNCF
jgi:hypothetical protein